MSVNSRRKLLKSIAGASGAVIAGKSLPEKWTRPVVDSVLLPSHALTSLAGQYTDTMMVVGQETGSTIERVMDAFVSEAKAGPEIRKGPRSMSCLSRNPDGTVSIRGIIQNEKGFARVSADNIPITGESVSLTIVDCPSPSGIGQATVSVTYLDDNKAVGEYSIGGGGKNIVPFDLPTGACTAPGCPTVR